MVYFIQEESPEGFVKIGYTASGRSIVNRLRALQNGNPRPLKIRAVLSLGGPRMEKELHRRFKRERQGGEWFAPSPLLLELMPWAKWNPTAEIAAVNRFLGVEEPRPAPSLPPLKRSERLSNRKKAIAARIQREVEDGTLVLRHLEEERLPPKRQKPEEAYEITKHPNPYKDWEAEHPPLSAG